MGGEIMLKKSVFHLTLAFVLALGVAGCAQKKTSLKDGTYTASTTGHNGPLKILMFLRTLKRKGSEVLLLKK